MASRKNKKKQPIEQKTIANTRSSQKENEYDISANFRKVRPYTKRYSQSVPSTEVINESYTRERSIRSIDDISSQTMGVPTWERYDRLEDKISDFNEKNEAAHSNLRQELERKIESSTNNVSEKIKELKESINKKLPIQWYSWTIGALVVFVGLVYTLSYSGLLSFKDSAEKRLIELELKQNQDNSQKCNNDSMKVDVQKHSK